MAETVREISTILLSALLIVLSATTPALASADVAVSSIAIERRVEMAPERATPPHLHVDYTLRYDGPGAIDYEVVDHALDCVVRFVNVTTSQTRRCAI